MCRRKQMLTNILVATLLTEVTPYSFAAWLDLLHPAGRHNAQHSYLREKSERKTSEKKLLDPLPVSIKNVAD